MVPTLTLIVYINCKIQIQIIRHIVCQSYHNQREKEIEDSEDDDDKKDNDEQEAGNNQYDDQEEEAKVVEDE